MIEKFILNDIVVMKKPHPCGENRWKIVRYGADVKLECQKCKRIVMITRPKFIKNVKHKVNLNKEC